MDAMQKFLAYADRYDRGDSRVELKIVHTREVADVMDRLTRALRLAEHTCHLAHLCAVYHDIGRFEQLKRYGTFLDNQSIDHAGLGCEILKEEGMLWELPQKEQKMVLTAVANHNRLQIEEGLDEDTQLLCRLIRDADKCDIFRVFATEDSLDTAGRSSEEVAGETISDAVLKSILEHRCVERDDRKTGLDIWVSFLAFFFDLNFKESLRILMKEKYYRIPFEKAAFTNPETVRRLGIIFAEAEGYVDKMLEGQEE